MGPRKALPLALVLLAPALLLTVSIHSDAMATPSQGTWTTALDPLGVTPTSYDVDITSQGHIGLMFVAGGTLQWSYSEDGSDAWTTNELAPYTGAGNHHLLHASGATWYAFFEAGTSWYAYKTEDNGATWTEKAAVARNPTNLAPVLYGSRIGIAVAYGTSVEWYRTSNDFASWDRQDLVLASSSNLDYNFLDVNAWNNNNVDVYYWDQAIGSTSETIRRVGSDDGGGFWSSPAIVYSTTIGTPAAIEVEQLGSKAVLMARQAIQSGCSGSSCDDALYYFVFGAPHSNGGGRLSYAPLAGDFAGACPGYENDAAVAQDKIYLYHCGWLHAYDGSTWSPVTTDPIPSNVDAGKEALSGNGEHLIAVINNNGFSDRFQAHRLRGVPALVTPEDQVAVNGLVGFDVSRDGVNIITREEGGNYVRAYNGVNLQQVAAIQTGCNRVDGVSVLGSTTTFVDCDANGDVDVVRVRDARLGEIIRPEGCGDECIDDISQGGFLSDVTIPEDLREIHNMIGTPPWAVLTNGRNSAHAVFGYYDFQGRIGAWGVTYNNVGQDFNYNVRRDFDTTATATNIQACFWRDQYQEDNILAVTPGGATKAWTLDIDLTDNSVGVDTMQLTLRDEFNNGVAYAQGKAVDCARDVAFIRNDDNELILVKTTSVQPVEGDPSEGFQQGQEILRLTGTTGNSRSVAISGDSKWLIYQKTASTFGVFDVIGQNETCEKPLPVGTLYGMALDVTAQVAHVATNQFIARYELWQDCTTLVAVGSDGFNEFGQEFGEGVIPGKDGTSEVPDGATIAADGAVAVLIDRMSPTARIITGLVIIALLMFGAYRLAGPAPMIVGGAAAIGLVANVAMGIWAWWVIVAIAGISGIPTTALWVSKRVAG